MPYVIKATRTLVYLDTGEIDGTKIGDLYLLVRFEEDGRRVWVAEVEIIRLFEEFSIAEIVSQVQGEEVEILQRAVSMEDWESSEGEPSMQGDEPMAESPRTDTGTRFVYLLGGMDWFKGSDLVRNADQDVIGFDRVSEGWGRAAHRELPRQQVAPESNLPNVRETPVRRRGRHNTAGP